MGHLHFPSLTYKGWYGKNLDFTGLGSQIDVDIYGKKYADLKHLPMEKKYGEWFIPISSKDQETIS